MDRDEFVSLYPVLYHTADARNWDNIRRFGLLSTSAILDAFGVDGADRRSVESMHRPSSVRVPRGGPHPALGHAVVRDQRPLQPEALADCLDDGLAPGDWYEILNGRVYFWPVRDRLERMLKVYLGDEQAVFEVEARRLLDRHAARAELSHINSGFASTRYRPVKRGRSTFVPFADYVYSKRNEVAELTVAYAVPDIFACTSRVVGRKRGRPDRVLWEATG